IVFPVDPIPEGGVGWCEIGEGHLGNEDVGDGTNEILCYNHGAPIAAGTRCEAIHYTQRIGGLPHTLNGSEEDSLCDLSEVTDISAREQEKEDEGCVVEWEIIPLEC